MKVMTQCTILWALAIATLCTQTASSVDQSPTLVASAAVGDEEPVTWDEFHRNFQFGLHCTLHTQPSKVTWNPTMHYTGPDSPFVQYVREMRTYGFSGILLQLRRPEAYVPEQDGQGKWRIPEDKMRQIHEAVDVATEAGYWLIIEVNPIKYEDLRDTRPHIKLKPEERYTDDWLQMDYDIWQQVIREFKSYRNIGYRTNNEFHGYKWEQELPPDHPKYLTAEQAQIGCRACLRGGLRDLAGADPSGSHRLHQEAWDGAALVLRDCDPGPTVWARRGNHRLQGVQHRSDPRQAPAVCGLGRESPCCPLGKTGRSVGRHMSPNVA